MATPERKSDRGRNNKAEQLNTLNAELISKQIRGFKVERSGAIRYNRPTYNVMIMGKVVVKSATSDEVSKALQLCSYTQSPKIALMTEVPETVINPNTASQGSVAAAAAELAAKGQPGSQVVEGQKPGEGERKTA